MNESSDGNRLVILDAYRPITFFQLISLLLTITILGYTFLSRNIINIVLLVVPIWLYVYVKKRLRPLSFTKIELVNNELNIIHDKTPKKVKVRNGRLNVTHTHTPQGENIHIEFFPEEDLPYRLEDKTFKININESHVFMGVRTDPLYLVLRIDNAVMLEANDYKVYLGLIKPVSVRIAEGESSNIGLEETTLKIKVSDTELPLSLYVRCECCGFSSKRILVGKIENMNIEPKILLGIPNYIGLLIIPDKPYLPSLLGRAFSLLGFPSSCVTNHPESRLFVELESPSRAQKLILRPRVTTE